MRVDAPPADFLGGLTVESTVTVRYAGRAVAAGIPLGGGRVVEVADQPGRDAPERLSNAVLPREWEGVVLDPSRKRGLLGAAGHWVDVRTTITTPDESRRWSMRMGSYQVTGWRLDGASVVIDGAGPLQALADLELPAPGSVWQASPISGEVMRILARRGLEAYLDPALPLRKVPAGFSWGVVPVESLHELAAAWPARVRAMPDGRVGFLAVDTGDIRPVLSWSDGAQPSPEVAPIVVSAPMEGSRRTVFNQAVVHVYDQAGDEVGAPVVREITTGPLAVETFQPRTVRVETEAVQSVAQAQAAGDWQLRQASLRARSLPVEMPADYRVQLDDHAEVITADGGREWGVVTGIDLPLTASDGAARVDVSVVG